MKDTISNHINGFLRYKKDVQNKSVKTYAAYKHDLSDKLLPFLIERRKNSVSEITREDVEEFLVLIQRGSKNGSVANRNRKLATIKSFFEYLQEKKFISVNKIEEIKAVKNHAKTISYLTEEEKERLLHIVETTATPFYRLRDIAILKLFLSTGVRVSELIHLRLQDLELHTKQTCFIRVKRKGGNEVRLPIKSKVVYAIRLYLAKREETDSTSHVFLSKNNKQLDANAVYHLVKHYLKESGIEKSKWGPHVLRHTVGVSLRRQGVDIATIQHLLGHTKLETTSIYLNVESQDLERAVQLL